MKYLKYLAVVALLCVVSTVSYYAGYHNNDTKNYEVAARLSDLVRCYEDHLQEDSLIEDYGCFEELEGLFLYDDSVGDPIDLSKYVYSY